jgi:rare lipoprotein A (peptidoglycan hydrolase)
MEALLLFKSRMKYGSISPEDFIPAEIFQKFPQLRTQYRAVINTTPFDEDMMNSTSTATVEAAVKRFKDLLIHSIVRSQQNNWIFITQVETYYHEKEIDDVAQVDQKDKYPQNLVVNMEKCQKGKGSWYELRFRCQKVEIIATGGYYNKEHDSNKLGAFLGVAAHLIWP